MKRRKGFTLIELLVVISIIALLLSIILPSMRIAKEKAKSVGCKSNLKQWGVVLLMYTSDNNDTFWVDDPSNIVHMQWLPMLESLYGSADNFRLCPSATKLRTPAGLIGMGATSLAWGGAPIFVGHGFADENSRNYASYGTNLWINSGDGWMGAPERQWQKTTSTKNTASIPMIFDCVWFGTNFYSPNDATASNPMWSLPTPTRDFFLVNGENAALAFSYFSGRACLDRHDKKVNMSFMDGSAKKVFLNELWNQNWHVNYERVADVDIPWFNR